MLDSGCANACALNVFTHTLNSKINESWLPELYARKEIMQVTQLNLNVGHPQFPNKKISITRASNQAFRCKKKSMDLNAPRGPSGDTKFISPPPFGCTHLFFFVFAACFVALCCVSLSS